MTNSAPLFDHCRERFISHEHWRGASRFGNLNQSAIPGMQTVRTELERWYSRFPDLDGDLRARFRGDDPNHDGAFFELFLHELLPRLGLSVEAHPTLNDGSRPDFLVTGAEGTAYLEATYLKQPFADPPLEAAVLNAIDDLDGRVPAEIGLRVEVEGTLNQAPPLRPITQRVCRWLNGLDPRTISWDHGPTIDIPVDRRYGDGVLQLRAVPRSGDTRGIGVWGSGVQSGSLCTEISQAVSKKARKYRSLDIPLIVAVNISSADAEREEEAALFGRVSVRLPRESTGDAQTPAKLVRTGKALWFDDRKRRRHYPRLSTVMMFRNLAPWTVANGSACCYLNPYVDDHGPLELRTLGCAAAVDGQLQRYDGGRSVRDVLELPQDWPGQL